MDDGEKGAWLPLAAASRALDATVDVLRKRIAAREIEARKDNKGRWLVRMPEELAAASQAPADDWKLASLQEELMEARERAARAEERAAAKDDQIKDLKEALAHERARADRLETDLRRPWWRRLIG
jgi:chromosome segregation ATPase